MLGLSPEQFFELAPWEFRLMLRSASQRLQGERRERVTMLANLMNCWLGRGDKVTVDELLGVQSKGRKLSEMGEAERKEVAQQLAEQARKRGEQKT